MNVDKIRFQCILGHSTWRQTMTRVFVLLTIPILLALFSCGEKTVIEDTPTVRFGTYWVDSFVGEVDQELDVDFRVTSGAAVDVFLLSGDGLNAFKSVMIIDTIIKIINDSIPYDTFSATRFGTGTKLLNINLTANRSTDIFLMDELNFNYYKSGQSFKYVGQVGVSSYRTVMLVEPDFLYLVIDNTAIGSPASPDLKYNLTLGLHRGAGFEYYTYGSCMGTLHYAASYTLVANGIYYYVVNNALALEGGAVPEGDVTMSIKAVMR